MNLTSTLKTGMLGACLVGLCAASAGAAELVKLRFNAQAEKHDATVNFQRGAIASIGVPGSIINGFQTHTSDFGQELPLYMIFEEPLSEERSTELAEFQFRLGGVAKCQLIQKGNSPDIPGIKMAVLAQNCKIVTLNH